MGKLQEMSREELAEFREPLLRRYEDFKRQVLRLDMSRGKPAPAQLDLSWGLLDVVNSKTGAMTETGVDTRNYGLLDGIPEAKRLFSELLDLPESQIIVGGVSSLSLMYETIMRCLLLGVSGGAKPWSQQGPLKFLCPVPGYDRHFAITEQFGFEMVNIPLGPSGPDMDLVERLVSSDPSVKGIWCVPKYSNPTGCVYSDETVRRFAALKPAADDFRIFWDNAYIVHDLYPEKAPNLLNIFHACEQTGGEDMVFEFSSTSKITFSGGGLSAFAASPNNIKLIKKQISIQTIGYDKLNQLRHARFFRNVSRLKEHMNQMAELIRPKFEAVLAIFDQEFSGLGIAEWTKPLGGYFISVDLLPGCAKRTVQLCKEAGVTLTGAGATYPYGKDPEDRNIRIAPTYPDIDELVLAARLFCLCAKITAAEKLGNLEEGGRE